jgi:hypothetical protein
VAAVVPQTGRLGDLEISISSSFLASPAIGYSGRLINSGPFLAVEVSVVNRSTSRLIEFTRWSASLAAEECDDEAFRLSNDYAFVRVTDEYGNVYRTFLDSHMLFKGLEPGPAYPNKPLRQKLLLYPPIDSATRLDFEFSGRAISAPGSLVLRLPLP